MLMPDWVCPQCNADVDDDFDICWPSVEVRATLPDGTEIKAVWSHLRQSGVAKLVTVHFFDRG